jgi:nucleotide-binding universal stress UspA family protein
MSVLVPVDFSETSAAALRTAADEARKRQTSLTLLHCVDSVDERWDLAEGKGPGNVDVPAAAAEKLEAFAQQHLPDDAPTVDQYRVIEDHAAIGIRDLEQEGGFELVVLGATGAGAVAQFFLGSTAEEVVRSSDTPVLVVPEGDVEGIDEILAPIDLSECSRRSLEAAADLARREDAHVTIIHASNLPTGAMLLMGREVEQADIDEHRSVRSEQLRDFLDPIDLDDVDYTVEFRLGHPERELLSFVEDHPVDRIVMGTHGRRGFDRFFLGSTAAKILRRIPCPVMTIRYREDGSSA